MTDTMDADSDALTPKDAGAGKEPRAGGGGAMGRGGPTDVTTLGER